MELFFVGAGGTFLFPCSNDDKDKGKEGRKRKECGGSETLLHACGMPPKNTKKKSGIG